MDVSVVHGYLKRSYWAKGIDEDVVRRSLDASLCVGLFAQDQQVAFARIITDYATFAYLADVFVLEDHRGKGLSKVMLNYLVDHPRLQGLRRWALFTKDAQGLYSQFGWSQYPWPERMMIREFPDIYA